MASLTAERPRRYNGVMAKPKRSARIAARVDEGTKRLAETIAEKMHWSLTDVYEKGIALLARQKDVRAALVAETATPESE